MDSPSAQTLANRAARGSQILLWGLAVNVALAVVKLLAGFFGASNALIADGLESALDVVSSGILYMALKYSTRPADYNHPYGHGKIESLAGAAGAMIVLLAGVFLAIHSVQEILSDAANRQAPAPFTLVVLAAVIIVKEILFRISNQRGKEVGSTAVQADSWHHRSDAITSLAAAIGISISLIGGAAWARADDWAALFSCVIIAWNGLRMMRASLGELLDEQAPEDVIQRLTQCAMEVEGVVNVEKCRVRKSGLTLLVDLHVRVPGMESVSHSHQIAHRVKDKLLNAGCTVSDVSVHIEPSELEDAQPLTPPPCI